MPATVEPRVADAIRQLKDALNALQPVRHSRDFCSVSWFGQSYVFTPLQARIVRMLWEGWTNQTPDIRQETLLIDSASDSGRLADIFKDHPAWNVMIVSVHRGAFRLAEPTD